MKRFKLYIIALLVLAVSFGSCVGDLDVSPIDPSIEKPEDVLDSEQAYYELLAKCYMGLATSGSDGAGSGDISGIDNGFGQYIRALFYMQEFTTDEALTNWNDATIQGLHGLSYNASDIFVSAIYYRCMQQIVTCNEFIRKIQKSEFAGSENVNIWVAEARALRALSYLHAIDLFGNYPFVTEQSTVGADFPIQKSRVEIFNYIESECKDIMPTLKAEKTNIYGRLDKGFAKMILAKLYINSEIYTGTARYTECADICSDLYGVYTSLHPKYNELFLADNNLRTDEIIFCVQQDGKNTQSYGCTNFIIFAATGGKMNSKDLMGVSSGWGGMRTTPDFVDLFADNDKRALFFTEGQSKEINNVGDYSNGYAVTKFRNITSTGAQGSDVGFVDTDFPLFRSADAYLMLAEAAKRGGGKDAEGLAAYNAVRVRAGLTAVTSYSLDDIIKERGRELYWECHRRSDLVRFNQYTTNDYLWAWKGGVKEGKAVDAKFNLMPLSAKDVNANSNLTQNPGY